MVEAAVRHPRRGPTAAWLALGGLALAIVLLAVALALGTWRPGLLEHLPPAAQRTLGALLPEPDWRPLTRGTWAERVRQRGVLVAAVRYYPRPAPPEAPTPPEPDGFDLALAQFIAQRLGVRLETLAVPEPPLFGGATPSATAPGEPVPDIVIAGDAWPAMGAIPTAPTPTLTVAGAYGGGAGRLVVLRGSAVQHARDLRQASVCLQQGSPYAEDLARRWGARPQTYPSAIHAISGFMAGECQALAEDEAVTARLMAREEWRFYRQLPEPLSSGDHQSGLHLATADADAAALLDRLLRQWQASGARLAAHERRVGDIAFEVTQLGDGLICHG
ncbi:MAG: ABC transporter substrate-binding protein [Comamonas sp.]